ncbi:SPF1 P-type ATPase [Scheffersomyces stipitis CBS 6054]|uniref:SPF1 P-type ATPase n=1 Tax=Scheffersomyces stipitis (strain ATCC 58785 / CBS 6054 / NBRC 10063 / NRRL Y-11545) TaxID=322104 RepID=A3M009_PICST|nr:SPF1 P-type ATPase [Scheffersomyces stipitis CBS 6054]ABN68633.1 SPF1 P-type ATPase [Scheffersomyces stipitis CBS 6054]
MLSGELENLLKESKLRPSDEKLQPDRIDKNSILHGGSSVLQVTKSENSIVPVALDNAALVYVTKTGFETLQSSLVRRKIFPSAKDFFGSKEALHFIMLMLQDFDLQNKIKMD